MNEIKLSGTVYNFRKFEKINMFSLRFYAGKDKEGKSLSGFCPCKTKLDLIDGQEINAKGWMGFYSYEKDGKKIEKVCFWVKELIFSEEKKIENPQPKPVIDEDIPFNDVVYQ